MNLILKVLPVIRSKRQSSSVYDITDGFVLRLHYFWTAAIFFGIFTSVFGYWYYHTDITCVSHYNVDAKLKPEHLNLCYTFPYVLNDDGSKEYLLYYKWLPYTMLIFAALCRIPRKISKLPETNLLNKTTNEISKLREDYVKEEQNMIDRVSKHFILTKRSQDSAFYKYLKAHIAALIIIILIFFSLDFILHYNFASLGYAAFPYARDFDSFNDKLCVAFPPFVKCQITNNEQLINERKEIVGCHLTYMEFYEKIFLFVWAWLIILIIITAAYIVFLCSFINHTFRKTLIKSCMSTKCENLDSVIETATWNFSVGDWFVLYRMQKAFYGNALYKILEKIGNRNLNTTVTVKARKDLPDIRISSKQESSPIKENSPIMYVSYQEDCQIKIDENEFPIYESL